MSTKGVTMNTCSICKKPIPKPDNNFTTGYAINDKNEKVCYRCCAEQDKEFMRKHGKIALYLTFNNTHCLQAGGKVTNWPETLKFSTLIIHKGRHNIAGCRYDCYFPFEGYWWHAVQYGDMTQICHCKRTKEKVK